MPTRDGYIPGVPCWVDVTLPDPEAALPFYQGVFGWTFDDSMPEGSGSHYFTASLPDGTAAAISSQPEGAALPTWNTYIWVDSADAAAEATRSAGGTVLAEPMDVFDAGRMAVLADPEGAVVGVWQANVHRGAQVVNEHGGLNFNGLATRDLDGAKAFYGTVFGWQTLDLPAGTMWTLPGYGDHLEAATPGLREQIAQMGGPEGFIDVVAAVNPLGDDDTTTPPHWSVTFGVDDVHAVAATAGELGGKVVVGPADVPWSRMAVIQDPQGATFVASQFVPENSELEA
jgi:uncharacterized protein